MIFVVVYLLVFISAFLTVLIYTGEWKFRKVLFNFLVIVALVASVFFVIYSIVVEKGEYRYSTLEYETDIVRVIDNKIILHIPYTLEVAEFEAESPEQALAILNNSKGVFTYLLTTTYDKDNNIVSRDVYTIKYQNIFGFENEFHTPH